MTRRESRDAPVVIDDIDRALIRELQVDGRMSYARLAPQVGLSQAAVRQRVQRLIDSGVMQVVAVTDPLVLGFTVMVMIGVEVEGDVVAAAKAAADMEEIDYVVRTAGRWDMILEAVCPDIADLRQLLDTIRAIEGVRSAEPLTYLHMVKQTYAWGVR